MRPPQIMQFLRGGRYFIPMVNFLPTDQYFPLSTILLVLDATDIEIFNKGGSAFTQLRRRMAEQNITEHDLHDRLLTYRNTITALSPPAPLPKPSKWSADFSPPHEPNRVRRSLLRDPLITAH